MDLQLVPQKMWSMLLSSKVIFYIVEWDMRLDTLALIHDAFAHSLMYAYGLDILKLSSSKYNVGEACLQRIIWLFDVIWIILCYYYYYLIILVLNSFYVLTNTWIDIR